MQHICIYCTHVAIAMLCFMLLTWLLFLSFFFTEFLRIFLAMQPNKKKRNSNEISIRRLFASLSLSHSILFTCCHSHSVVLILFVVFMCVHCFIVNMFSSSYFSFLARYRRFCLQNNFSLIRVYYYMYAYCTAHGYILG